MSVRMHPDYIALDQVPTTTELQHRIDQLSRELAAVVAIVHDLRDQAARSGEIVAHLSARVVDLERGRDNAFAYPVQDFNFFS